jgi:MoxR-like ATPase
MAKFNRYELIALARTRGWRGKGGGTTPQLFMDWLTTTGGMTYQQVMDSLSQMRRGKAILSLEKTNGTTTAGISAEQVQQLTSDMIEKAMSSYDKPEALDMNVVRKLIAEAVAKASPDKIVVNEITKQAVKVDGAHPVFEKVLKLVAQGVNVLLVGPAGCGKTTLAHMVAKALKRKFGMLSCTAGASESQLTGWLLPVGAGKQGNAFSYVPSEFVRLYEEGNAVFLFDEFDAADPNMLLVMNSALANGSLHVPQRHEEPLVKRGKNMAMIAAANTYGSGADMIYAGRNQLDAATLDRFYVVEMDYDRRLEESLAEKEVVEWVWSMREKVRASRLRRVISTRAVQKLSAALRAGVAMEEAKKDLLAGWTRDELAKLGAA